MPWSQTAKHLALNAQPNTMDLKLFAGDPTAGGAEITGSGYSAKSATFAAAANGERRLSADVDFGYSSSGSWATATHVAVYNGATLMQSEALAEAKTANTYTKIVFRAGTTDLRLRLTDA